MKLQFWVAIAAANALWGPGCALAQDRQGGLPMPQGSVNQPATSEGLLPNIDPALPNRRVPSLAPPRSSDGHPVVPDEAWPKPQRSNQPVRPSLKGLGNSATGEPLSGKGRPEIEGSLEGINGSGKSVRQ